MLRRRRGNDDLRGSFVTGSMVPVETGVRPEEAFGAEAAATKSFDGGFHLVATIDEASKLAGYSVLEPAWLPDGFELTHIAYSPAPLSQALYGASDVVVLTYRNAGWQIDVTMRDASTAEEWFNPYDPGGDVASFYGVDEYEIVTEVD